MTDLRKSFRNIQRKYGHNILLQRKDLAVEASGIYRDQDNRGYRKELERYTVRMQPVSKSNANLIQAAQEQMEGVVTNVDMIFFFQWNAAPKEADRIYVEDDRYKVPGSKKYYGYELYVIDYAVGHRGLGGRIEFWTVGANRVQPD